MATRHSRKERENYAAFDHVGAVNASPTATRMDKIRALNRMGFVLSPKTNAARVDAKFDEVFGMVLEVVNQDADRKRARNQRKRARRNSKGRAR